MIVCVKDGRELEILKNSVVGQQLDGNGDPYKIFYGDTWRCPECGIEMLALAPHPVAEHYEQAFALYSDRVEVQFH